MSAAPTLLPWQLQAVAAWERGDPRGPCRGTLEIFTGGGKTLIALECIARAMARRPGLRVAVVVPTQALVAQWRRALQAHPTLSGAPVGQLGAGRQDDFGSHRVLVCVLNSAAKRLPELLAGPSAAEQMLVVDECHRAGAPTFSRVLTAPAAFRLGLSATPDREELDEDGEPLGYDAQVLGRLLGEVVFSFDLKQARAVGWLPDYAIYHHGVALTDAERRQYDAISRAVDDLADRLRSLGVDSGQARRLAGRPGDTGRTAAAYVGAVAKRKDLLYRASERARVARALLRARLRRQPTPRVLLFHERVDEAVALHAALGGDLEVPVALEHSRLPASTRQQALQRFADGSAPVIVSVRSLVEGINVPEADIGMSVASSASVRQRVQSLGRVLRRRFDQEAPVKVAEMHVLYSVDTVDELIYAKEDWSDLTGEAANHYLVWPLDATEPERRDGPPATPRPTEEQEWERLGRRPPAQPSAWLGMVPEREYSVDTRGTVSSPTGAVIENPQGVADMVAAVRGRPGGRFRVTPGRRLVIVFGGDDDHGPRPLVAGQLHEPFRVADLEQPGVEVDASALVPGAPYPGRASREGGTFKLRHKHGGVIERRGGSGGSEFALTDPTAPDQRIQNGVRLLQAWHGTGEGGLTFHVSAAGHAWFLKAGQPRFLADVGGGFAWPSERQAPPDP